MAKYGGFFPKYGPLEARYGQVWRFFSEVWTTRSGPVEVKCPSRNTKPTAPCLCGRNGEPRRDRGALGHSATTTTLPAGLSLDLRAAQIPPWKKKAAPRLRPVATGPKASHLKGHCSPSERNPPATETRCTGGAANARRGCVTSGVLRTPGHTTAVVSRAWRTKGSVGTGSTGCAIGLGSHHRARGCGSSFP